MQIRCPTNHTAEEYVRNESWKYIRISRCPIHTDHDCRLLFHGVYIRAIPNGTKIPRFLCPTENITISLLPDCFSSRLSGPLVDIEIAVSMVEEAIIQDQIASGSGEVSLNTDIPLSSLDLGSAAQKMNVEQRIFDLAADFRWLKRRLDYVLEVLTIMILLFPAQFKNCLPSITSFRSVLGDDPILAQLREIAESELHKIPKPVGLNPRFPPPQDTVWRPP